MTQEEKAKAYDEALERAKAYHRNELAGSKKEMMEYIFPELRESEDERIRKWLVELVQNTDTNHSNMKLSENCKLALAYLEKQEQKPAWSEEDEKIRRNLMSLLADMRGDRITEETYQKYYPWLSALRPGWKPTEEQMEALNKARRFIPYNCDILESLYEQLKKL